MTLPVYSINEADRNALDKSDYQEWYTRTVVVDKLEPVLPGPLHQREAEQEGDDANQTLKNEQWRELDW